MSSQVRMTRADSGTPWGFRLQGGRDFNAALTIQKVSKGGMAQRHGICVGDLVVSIGGDPAGHWTHQQAQQAVIRCGNELELGLVPGGGGLNHTYFQPQPQKQQQVHYQPVVMAPYSPPVRQTAGNVSSTTWMPAAAASPSSPSARYYHQPAPALNFSQPRAVHSPQQPHYPQQQHHQQQHHQQQHHQQQHHQQQHHQQQHHQPHFSPPAPPPPAPMAHAAGGGVGLSGRSRRGEAQRRTHQTAGGVPVCAVCGSVIRGPFLVALDKCFCPDHFNCSVCGRNLEPCGFVEEANQLYCEDDYVRLLAPRCGGCHQTIVNESVHAMDQYFHRQCFVCAHCRQSIAGRKFRVEDNRPYCEKDWGDLFFTKCAKCHEAIAPIDRFIEVLGGTYHAECFCCAVCGTCLEGKPFAPKDGKAYCKLHARRF